MADKENKNACKNCKFSDELANPSYSEPALECRRLPPTQATDKQKADPHPFPIVSPECWCGEFDEKPEIETETGE